MSQEPERKMDDATILRMHTENIQRVDKVTELIPVVAVMQTAIQQCQKGVSNFVNFQGDMRAYMVEQKTRQEEQEKARIEREKEQDKARAARQKEIDDASAAREKRLTHWFAVFALLFTLMGLLWAYYVYKHPHDVVQTNQPKIGENVPPQNAGVH
jgi:cell division protein FtsL